MFEKPIFIVGCTNSGTKCLFYSLLQHPDLGGFDKELHFYGIQPNIDGRVNRLFSLFPCFNTNYLDETLEPRSFSTGPTEEAQVKQLLTMLLERTDEGDLHDGDRLLIKEPKLSLRIRWLKKLFPDSHIIAIVRNPWAVAEGIVRKCSHMGDVPLNLDIPTAAAQWNITNTIIRMDSAGIDGFHLVRYEDMIRADKFPNGVESNCFWSRLLAHLELDPEGFTIPNGSKYSRFVTDNDQGSMSRLSPWDVRYISYACKDLIEHYGYGLGEREKDGK